LAPRGFACNLWGVHETRSRWRPPWWLVLGVAWVLGAAVGGHYLTRGWVPHDAGSLAQSAERVLAGELPHRDFDEIYTGGLSFLHGLAFRLVGTSLMAPRLVLFAVFMAWLPAVYYVAGRFVSPLAAGLATLVAALWTVPNYSEAVPSWYNLFFAVFGVAALLRHLETGGRRWLVIAGVAGGLSCLAKIVGLYYVAAVLLFLVYREHCLAREEARPGGRGYVGTVGAGLLVLVALVAALIRRRAGVVELIDFLVPVAALTAWLTWQLWSEPAGSSRDRFTRLGRLVLPFALGAAGPILVFLAPYALSGSLGALWAGVFIVPGKRLRFATMDFPALWTTLVALAPAALLWRARHWPTRWRQRVALVLGLGLLAALVYGDRLPVYRGVWYAARPLVPLTVLAGVALLSGRTRFGAPPAPRRQQLVLLLGVAALCGLVQFPFAAPIYFCYVGPLGLLAAIAVVATWDRAPHPIGGALLGFYFGFALLWLNTGFIYAMGLSYLPDRQTEPLALERGAVRVSAIDKAMYEEAVAAVRAHAQGDYIWAGPDCPEVYFLAGKRNPTRTLFDFFDEPAGRTARVLAAIERHDVHVVVFNRRPPFSGAPPSDLVEALVERFPHTLDASWLHVRWRE